MSSPLRRAISRLILRFGDLITTFLEGAVLITTTALAAATIFVVLRDFASMMYVGIDMSTISALVDEVLMLIIFAEIVRSVVVSHGKPETYVLAIGEVGFVITIREMLAAVIMRDVYNLLLSAGAALMMAGALWIIKEHVVKT